MRTLRGTGLGSAVLRSLLAWGAERGATTTYLQVVVANTAAQELYQAHGYDVHHRYDYLVLDPQSDRSSQVVQPGDGCSFPDCRVGPVVVVLVDPCWQSGEPG